MAGSWSQYKALLHKDIERELRTFDALSSMGIYAILILVVYGVALSQASAAFDVSQIGGGLLWALIVFTSLLGLNRSFSYEKENGCLDGLLLVPMDRSVLFLAKATSNVLFLGIVEIVVVPLFVFFFLADVALPDTFPLVIAPLLLGTIGMAGVGTLLATMTVNTRGKDVMLAVLMVPLIFPLLYGCVAATSAVMLGAPDFMDAFLPAIVMAVVYDVVMFLASWALYDFVVSA